MTPVKLTVIGALLGSITFNTPLSDKIINAPRLVKVKMANLELYDETAGLEEHQGVYKAQMYVQDVGDATYLSLIHI